MKVTLTDIKAYISLGIAIDCTHKNLTELKAIRSQEKGLDLIKYSSGPYGINGVILYGNESGTLYVIAKQTSAIFALL